MIIGYGIQSYISPELLRDIFSTKHPPTLSFHPQESVDKGVTGKTMYLLQNHNDQSCQQLTPKQLVSVAAILEG